MDKLGWDTSALEVQNRCLQVGGMTGGNTWCHLGESYGQHAVVDVLRLTCHGRHVVAHSRLCSLQPPNHLTLHCKHCIQCMHGIQYVQCLPCVPFILRMHCLQCRQCVP